MEKVCKKECVHFTAQSQSITSLTFPSFCQTDSVEQQSRQAFNHTVQHFIPLFSLLQPPHQMINTVTVLSVSVCA